MDNDIKILAIQEAGITNIQQLLDAKRNDDPSPHYHQSFHSNYQQYCRKMSGERGLYLAIHNEYKPRQIEDLTNKYMISAKCKINNNDFMIINIYAPPDELHTAYATIVQCINTNIHLYNGFQFILCGDFNSNSANISSTIINAITPQRLWRTTTGHNPITYHNTNEHTNAISQTPVDHVWYACNPSIKIHTNILPNGSILPIIKTQHSVLQSTITFTPTNQPSIISPPTAPKSPPQHNTITSHEKLLIDKFEKIQHLFKSQQFRKKLLFQSQDLGYNNKWNNLYQILIQLTQSNRYDEQTINLCVYHFMLCSYNVINEFIQNNTIPLQNNQFSIKRSMNMWDKLENMENRWKLLFNYKKYLYLHKSLHFNNISHYWSRNLITIIEQQQHQHFQSSWSSYYYKYINKQIKLTSTLKIDGKYKESNQKLRNLLNNINGSTTNPKSTPNNPMSISIPNRYHTPTIIDNPQQIANAFATNTNNNIINMTNEHILTKKQIQHLESIINNQSNSIPNILNAKTQLDQIKINTTRSRISASSMNRIIKPSQVAYSIANGNRNSVPGTDFFPFEFLLACCETNHTFSQNNTNRTRTIGHKIKRKNFQFKGFKHQLSNRPAQLGKKFYSTIRSNPNPMLLCITKLFNIIYKSGHTPTLWKTSHITMLNKTNGNNNNEHNIDDFRPISIGSNLQKVLNKILCYRLEAQCKCANLLHLNQTAYQEHRERFENLLIVTELAHKSIQQNQNLWTLFIDIRKAFDSISHYQLFNTLKLKLPNATIFTNYIENMYNELYFTIKFNNHFSPLHKQTCGIKQGCIISPLLFLIFFNEVTTGINDLLGYADDLVLLSNDPLILKQNMEKLMVNCNKLNLHINTRKTELMVFHHPNLTPRQPHQLTINNHNYIAKESIKYLGLILHQHLKIDHMIDPLKKYVWLTKSIENLYIPTNIKQHIINQELYSRIFHNAPIIGLLITNNNHNYDYFMDNIVKPMDKLIINATNIKNNPNCHTKNVHPIIAYSILQITPPIAFIKSQTTRLLNKFTTNKMLSPNISNTIFNATRSRTNITTSIIAKFFFQTSADVFSIPILETKTKTNPIPIHIINTNFPQIELFNSKTISFQIQFETIRKRNISALVFDIVTRRMFRNCPNNPNIFKFNSRTGYYIDFLPEFVKHTITINNLNELRINLNQSQPIINAVEKYIQCYNTNNQQIISLLSSLFPQIHRGWTAINKMYTNSYVAKRYLREVGRSVRIMCNWCESTHFTPKHCLFECNSNRANYKRYIALQQTLYMFNKYKWKHIFYNELQFYQSNLCTNIITKLSLQYLNDPDLSPYRDIFISPFSYQSNNILKLNNIVLENMRSRWWDDYNGTYIPEEIADDESLLYKTICTSQYFQLYDYQHARRQWRYIKYPNTMDILNRLFSLLGGNINDESFIYGVIAPSPQIPYIIRLFIFLYIAHASESLLY